MIHLMELELRKVNLRPYIYAGFAAILCMVGLLYTFAMIAHVGGDSDAAEFFYLLQHLGSCKCFADSGIFDFDGCYVLHISFERLHREKMPFW